MRRFKAVLTIYEDVDGTDERLAQHGSGWVEHETFVSALPFVHAKSDEAWMLVYQNAEKVDSDIGVGPTEYNRQQHDQPTEGGTA